MWAWRGLVKAVLCPQLSTPKPGGEGAGQENRSCRGVIIRGCLRPAPPCAPGRAAGECGAPLRSRGGFNAGHCAPRDKAPGLGSDQPLCQHIGVLPACTPLLGVPGLMMGQVKPPRCSASHLDRVGRSVPHPHAVSLLLVAGFTGAHCEIDIDECDPDPCHYGTCKDSIASFTCLCQPGYTGHRCDININECQSQPCKNGGTCQDRNNAYNCICLKGTAGEQEGTLGAPCGSAVPVQYPAPILIPGQVGPGPPPAAALVLGPAWGILGEGEFSRFGAQLWQEPRPSRELPMAEALCCGAAVAVSASGLHFTALTGLGMP